MEEVNLEEEETEEETEEEIMEGTGRIRSPSAS
jgi:glutaredoxin